MKNAGDRKILRYFSKLNWQQSGSRAQRYVPLSITIRPKENIKISKLLISFASNWDS